MASSRRGPSPELELELEIQNGSPNPAPSSASAAEVGSVTSEGHRGDRQLEPADRGLAAWKVLCAAFMFEAVLWGEDLKLSTCFIEELFQFHHY